MTQKSLVHTSVVKKNSVTKVIRLPQLYMIRLNDTFVSIYKQLRCIWTAIMPQMSPLYILHRQYM